MAESNTNQNRPIRMYQKQFASLLTTVFSAKAAFRPAFGTMQTLDGIQHNATMFSLKTNDMPVVMGTYSTDANTGFGTGTGSGSRFGEMQEITYKDTDVPYAGTWALHEGFDRFTVNNDMTAAVADRLALQAEAKVRFWNGIMGKFLVDNATKDLGEVTDLNAVFVAADKYYTEAEVDVDITAYVNPTIYNGIIDLANTVTGKNSSVNIDTNGVVTFRGFKIEKTAEKNMAGAPIIFTPDNIARIFIGIETTRTIEATQFDGQELQGAGKYGEFISDDNKKAILTAGVTPKP